MYRDSSLALRMTGPAGRLCRSADYKLRRQPPPQPSGRRPVKPENLWAVRRIKLKNPSVYNPSTQPAAIRRPQPSAKQRPFFILRRQPPPQPSEPFEPSRPKDVSKAIPQPSGQRPVKPENLWAVRRIKLKNPFFTTFLHNLPPSGGHNLRPLGPSTLTPEGRVQEQ